MTLIANILFFIPLCFVVCLVASVLRRETIREATREGLRLFLRMSVGIILICAAMYFVMEWRLGY